MVTKALSRNFGYYFLVKHSSESNDRILNFMLARPYSFEKLLAHSSCSESSGNPEIRIFKSKPNVEVQF